MGATAVRRATEADVNGQAVGMLGLTVFERMPRPGAPAMRCGYVGNVFVLAPHRGAGIGGRLVDAAVDYAREHAFARLVLAPSEQSRPFYRRAGFGPADMLLALPLEAP